MDESQDIDLATRVRRLQTAVTLLASMIESGQWQGALGDVTCIIATGQLCSKPPEK